LTRGCFFVSVIEHTSEQQDRCFRPRSTRNADPGWEHLESIECERLGTCTSPLLRKARPLPAVTGAMPRFLSSDGERPEIRLRPATRHLSSSCDGAGVRGDARQPATNTIARSKDLRVTRSPRRETRTVGPRRLPSSHRSWLAASIGGELSRRRWTLKRGSTRPTRECLLLPRMIANPTRRTTLRLEW
jgi:hypothetical protein